MTDLIEPEPVGEEYEPVIISKKMRVATQDWRHGDGKLYRQHIIKRKAVVAVLPLRFDQGYPEVLLVRQFRKAVRAWVSEAVAGGIDSEDCPDVTGNLSNAAYNAAIRELAEETGMCAGKLIEVGSVHVSPGWTDEHVTLFLAFDLVDTGKPRQGWDADNIELRWTRLSKAWAEVRDLKTLALLGIIERKWSEKPDHFAVDERDLKQTSMRAVDLVQREMALRQQEAIRQQWQGWRL